MSWSKVVACSISVCEVSDLLTAMLQMSQFHWHVTDSHSFPLQIPGFEEVAEKGAYSPSMIYTPSDVQDIISFAAEVSPTGVDAPMWPPNSDCLRYSVELMC